jgi:large subunit ribosomal protein L22
MPGVRTNEVPGTRAVLRHYRMSAYKARQVLDMVRGQDVDLAEQILVTTPREGARVVAKVLASAVANARNNDQLEREELYISSCFADEGATLKRWRPRARGRATRIRKRTCHITVIVSRLPVGRLERKRSRLQAATTAMRSRRVAASRRDAARRAGAEVEAASDEEPTTDEAPLDEEVGTEETTDEVETTAPAETDEGSAEEGSADEESADEGAQRADEVEAVVTEDESLEDSEDEVSTVGHVAADEVADEAVDETDEAGDTAQEGADDGAEPPPEPRRARGVRKAAKKAKAETEDSGEAAGSDENEKG